MAIISQKNLYLRFKKFIAEFDLIKRGDRVLVACSGGPDSVCLLYLLQQLSSELDFSIIVGHYNHRIRGREADRDEKFVKELSEKFGYDFYLGQLKSGEKIKNEEDARNLRYEFLEKARGEGRADKIFIAHNKNDLAETLLINLVRGAGIRGLSSMKIVSGRLVRPLLFAEKSEILGYLKQNNIKFCTDSSNDSLDYTRNIMRHKIIPELQRLNPKLLSALWRTSELAGLCADFIRNQAEASLAKICHENKNEKYIERKKFTSLSPAVASEIIRILAEDYDVSRDLSLDQVEEVVKIANQNIGGKQKVIAGKPQGGPIQGLKFELKAGRLIVSKVKGIESQNR